MKKMTKKLANAARRIDVDNIASDFGCTVLNLISTGHFYMIKSKEHPQFTAKLEADFMFLSTLPEVTSHIANFAENVESFQYNAIPLKDEPISIKNIISTGLSVGISNANE